MTGDARDMTRPDITRIVARGARRLLRDMGFAALAEVPLPSGRRADLVALAPDGTLHIVEIKSSRADFLADRKWSFYLDHCDRFWFAFPQGLSPELFPQGPGLIVADAHGGEMLREAPLQKLAPAARKAMLVRFGLLAAERLHLAAARESPFVAE